MDLHRTDTTPAVEPRLADAEHFRALIEHASDLIAIFNADGSLRYASPSHERVLGYPPAELVGRSVFELVHPEDVARVIATFADHVQHPGVAPSIEFRFHHRDGSWRVVEAIGNNLLTDPGVGSIVVNSRDITERKQAEQKTAALLEVARTISGTLEMSELLARVERQAAAALTCDAVATFYWDERRRAFRLVSQFGVPPTLLPDAQALHLPSDPFGGQLRGGRAVVVNDVSAHPWLVGSLSNWHEMTALIAAPLVVRGHIRGALVAIAATTGRSFGADQVDLCEGIARQVAVAIEAADAYRAQKDEAHVASALARVGRELIFSVDTPVLLDRLSQLTAEVLECDFSHTFLWQPDEGGYAPVAGYGDTPEQWESLRVLRVPRSLVAGLLAHFEQQDVAHVLVNEAQGLVPAGLLAQYGVTCALYAAIRRGKDVIGILSAGYRRSREPFSPPQERIAAGIAQIASLALANAGLVEELERVGRIKSDFVATISHELRTPLNLIMGYNDLLLEGAFGQHVAEEVDVLRRIHRSARELLELINTTLDLSRLESGRLTVETTPVAVTRLMDEIETETQEFRDKPGLQFTWQIAPRLPRLQTDPLKLKVVLKNLIANAVKFTDEGSITVSAVRCDRGVEFRVADTGIGIAAEMVAVIFEPFRQGDSSDTRRHGGVGLGLYIVRRLLDILGGTIAVESTVGHGSTFRVWLPAAAPRNRRAR
ncbi:MAG: PAS domain S-box protein [Deltaproteobacteria bacterium]|nr:PAS domain S-box protein [Deltaproteobacteria bacterium]MBI3388236.1 PAS domain S-box protein [Deltaproteobacteria bacterium]